MPDITADQATVLEAAYAKLNDATGAVSLAALRREAAVGQTVAAEWLKAKRATDEAAAAAERLAVEPAVPSDLTDAAQTAQAQIITDTWHRALDAARRELADRHSSELATARLAEHEATERAAAADELVATLRAKNTDLTDKLAVAEKSLQDLRATQKHHRDTAAAAQADAAAAQAEAAAAQAEAAELRGELRGIRAAIKARGDTEE